MRRPLRLATPALVFALLSGCLGAASAFAQEDDPVKIFMRAKLKHGQKVLEGLTTGDFDLIAKNAQQLSLLSQATTWQVLQTPEYARRSAEFRRSADELKEAAKDGNLDRATLNYLDVTMKCIDCHKYVRRVRNARLDLKLDSPIRSVRR